MKRSTILFFAVIALGSWIAYAAAPPTNPNEIPEAVRGAEGLDEVLRNLRAKMATTPPLSPQQALAKMQVRKSLTVDLIAHEPTVRQPLYLNFDERGRMWVVQYRQYPFPAGLRVVSYDRYIRAKFNKVPPPPPNHFRGEDKITIHEDVKGDGSYSKVTTFVEGLNIATAALPGRGGVWVMNPPYLLFYPDKDRTDKPSNPIVHLSGFGLEDTHSVASSLCWGPDGWIYGAQGSTCTAKVRVEVTGEKKTTDFLGQAIWRYHPEDHRFEIFAEGGGNTFGVAFDEVGRVYSGTNWGKYRGLHYVQGGYYIKGWGKHGPLTNPYALGYFDHMPHVGDADRLVHTFIVYGGERILELQGRIIGVNALQKRVQVTRLLPERSSFRTEEEPFLLWTEDERFRPVDVKAGPDGALYLADLYEPRINHVDPRDNWDRATGRIYRVRPQEFQAAPQRDLARLSSTDLVEMLSHKDRWHREMALRLLGDRKDRKVLPMLRQRLREKTQGSLEALWAIHQIAGLDEPTALHALRHDNASLRRWAVRLLGDTGKSTEELTQALTALAEKEKDPEVRSQLASSAKRLPLATGLSILVALWSHKEDVSDPHIPLLTWWALEAKLREDRQAVLKLFSHQEELWEQPIVKQFILERLTQRWAMSGEHEDLLACGRLLSQAPNNSTRERLLKGLEAGFAGRAAPEVPPELRQAISLAWERGATTGGIALGMRIGHGPSLSKALALIDDEKGDRAIRQQCIRIFGEINDPRCVDKLLRIVRESRQGTLRQEALGALQRYNEARIPAEILKLYPSSLPEQEGVRAAAHDLFASRPAWSLALLQAIDQGKVPPGSLPLEAVRKLQLHQDKEVMKLLSKHFGQVRASTSREKQTEMVRIARLLKSGKGDAVRGKTLFANTCGKCHKLYGAGGEIGPDLTGYERSNTMYWIENILDPSAAIREEYMTFVVETADGRTLQGIIVGQDKTTVTLRDQEGRTTRLDRSRIEEMRASRISLMPEDQLKTLKEQEVRDLFAFLMSRSSPK